MAGHFATLLPKRSLEKIARDLIFPVLVKFIDAQDKLSVQVHPNDEYALKHENSLGKTEMWYIVDAKPGAKIIYGLNGEYTSEQLRAGIDIGEFTPDGSGWDAKLWHFVKE